MRSFIFSNHPAPRLARHLAFWALYFADNLLAHEPDPGKWWQIDRHLFMTAMADALRFLPVFLLGVYSAVYVLLPLYLRKRTISLVICYAILLLSITIPAGYYIIKPKFAGTAYTLGDRLDIFSQALNICMANVICLVVAAVIIKIMKDHWLRQRENELLALENIRNKLDLLKMQMHPRMLFASLQRIHLAIDGATGEAPEMILKLSDLLSYLLYESDSEQVPMSKEITMIENYVALKKLEHKQQIDLKLETGGQQHRMWITPGLFLPLLEIGIERSGGTGQSGAITVELRALPSRIHFRLINRTPGNNAGKDPMVETDLRTVKERLRSADVQKYKVDLWSGADGLTIVLQLEPGKKPSTGLAAETGKSRAMSIQTFIFSRGRKASLKRHLALWIGGYVIVVLTYPPHGSSIGGIEQEGFVRYYKMVMIRCFFHFLCQMIFCYPLLYYLVPVFLRKKGYARFAFLLVLLLAMASYLRYALFLFVYNPMMRGLKFYVNSQLEALYNSITQNFDGPAFMGFLFISFKLFKDWQQKQKDNLDLRKENANAELLLLKARIHPHFLFNTLNNIYSFTLDQSPQAKKMVKMLEDMLHYMIEECEQPMVSLAKEISILKDYFELERIRYGNTIDMQFEVAGDATGKVITPLLMIPFVENSFKHGASRILREPWIKLFIQADDDVVHFSLTNSKPAEEMVNHKKGIGLYNVKKRLDLLYPAVHLLVIESTMNTFTVNMQIPIGKS